MLTTLQQDPPGDSFVKCHIFSASNIVLAQPGGKCDSSHQSLEGQLKRWQSQTLLGAGTNIANCGWECWEKLHHGETVQPWSRSPEGLGETLSLKGVQISAGQSHSRPDLALSLIQEDGIQSDFQRSLAGNTHGMTISLLAFAVGRFRAEPVDL